MVQKTDAFQVDGLVEQIKELDALMMSNPAMEKKVKGLIRKVLSAVRSNMSKAARDVIKDDPRQAYKAVKSTVYRQILGGSVSILSKRRASGVGGSYTPKRNPSKRGGNRRKRSERTIALQSYWGADRGFILRFLNAGTTDRYINFLPDSSREHVHRGSRGGNLKKYGRTINTGYRGRIASRNWFGSRSQREMEFAAENLSKYIDALIKQELQ